MHIQHSHTHTHTHTHTVSSGYQSRAHFYRQGRQVHLYSISIYQFIYVSYEHACTHANTLTRTHIQRPRVGRQQGIYKNIHALSMHMSMYICLFLFVCMCVCIYIYCMTIPCWWWTRVKHTHTHKHTQVHTEASDFWKAEHFSPFLHFFCWRKGDMRREDVFHNLWGVTSLF